MAVIGVFGLPGMGKTSFLTKVAQLNLRGKSYMGIPVHEKVFTNFECAGCYKLDFNKLGIYHFENALILIDEIMLLADSRDFKSFPEHLKYFFSHHRHFDCTVLFCSQYWSDCDKRIRGVTDRYYLITCSSFFPLSYIKPIVRHFDVYQGTIFDGYTLGPPISWKVVYRPRWYMYFDSYTQRELPPIPELSLWGFDDLPPTPPTLIQRIKDKLSHRKRLRSESVNPKKPHGQEAAFSTVGNGLEIEIGSVGSTADQECSRSGCVFNADDLDFPFSTVGNAVGDPESWTAESQRAGASEDQARSAYLEQFRGAGE